MRSLISGLFMLLCAPVFAQQQTPPIINFQSVPNPLQLPQNMYFGEVSGIALNSKGHVFVLSRGNTTGPAYNAFRSIRAMIESISAITLATHNMSRAVRFYSMLGFEIIYGGEDAAFTSFRAGTSYLNLIVQPVERNWSWWGRVIFYHSDVDALHANVIAAGYAPDTAPRDAEWGERFFHLTDPDGHELSFAWPLR
jgi:catechol 2,3-dioxygenase-like lactoylglutathione lyase family enzyme